MEKNEKIVSQGVKKSTFVDFVEIVYDMNDSN